MDKRNTSVTGAKNFPALINAHHHRLMRVLFVDPDFGCPRHSFVGTTIEAFDVLLNEFTRLSNSSRRLTQASTDFGVCSSGLWQIHVLLTCDSNAHTK